MAASQLAKRWAVAIVGVPVVIGLLYLGGWALGLPVAAIAGLGAREVYRLARVKGQAPFDYLGATATVLLVVAATEFGTFQSFAPWALGILGALAGAALLGSLVMRPADGTPLSDVSVTLFGAVYVGLPLSFALLLHSLPTVEGWGQVGGNPWLGLQVVALPLASTWIGDSVAFFAGTAWGKAKIAPSISPNKSWVGSIAGLLGSAAAASVWFVWVRESLPGLPIEQVLIAAGVGALLGVGAQIGDFAESLLKREAGVKDSGTLLPGHGGVLDRLDALFATAPLSFVVLILLGSYL